MFHRHLFERHRLTQAVHPGEDVEAVVRPTIPVGRDCLRRRYRATAGRSQGAFWLVENKRVVGVRRFNC